MLKVINMKNRISISNLFIQFKFTIITVLYFCIITFFQIGHLKVFWYPINILNAISLLLYLFLFGRGRFRYFFLIIFSVLLTLDAYYAFFFHRGVSIGIIASIFETTSAEAKGVMKVLFPGSLVLLSITTFLILLSANELGKLKMRRKYGVILLAVYLFVGIPGYMFLYTNYSPKYQEWFKDAPVLTFQEITTRQSSLLYGTLSSIAAYYYERREVQRYSEDWERSLPDGISLNQHGTPQKIYFIVGESQWRKHMSIYGYPIKTTPFLDSLYQVSDDITIYRNFFSPACITRDALRILLSFATPQKSSFFYIYKNLFELANDAGYKTLWMTSQDAVHSGLHDSYASKLVPSSNVYHHNRGNDLQLVSIVKREKLPDMKQFYFINLYGSHTNYTNYDDTDKAHISDNGIIADYDRTIHHTDRFMRNFYKMIENDSSSVVVYISDHGEILELKGHGFLGKGSSQFEVPLLTINHSNIPIDSLVNKYIVPGKDRINTLIVTYILLELMGYTISDEQIDFIRQQSNYVYHVDGKWYEYETIEAENKN